MQWNRVRWWGLAFLLAGAVAACGGGSGGRGEAGDGDAQAGDNAAPAHGDGDAPAGGDDIACGLADFQAEALRLINQRRAAGARCGARGHFAPTTALAWDTRLAQAAYGHSRDMADRENFSHTGSDGSTLGQRVGAAGYAWSAVGENIAAGTGSVAATIDGWMASDGHCANLMNPGYRHVGLACAARSGSRYGRYWTLDLAAPR